MGSPLIPKGGSLSVNGTPQEDVTTFSSTRTSNNVSYASSSTNGKIARVAGHQDSTITWTMLADAGSFALLYDEGDTVTIIGTSITGRTISGSYIIDEISTETAIGEDTIMVINVSASLASGSVSAA
jgi:hypothetical protein